MRRFALPRALSSKRWMGGRAATGALSALCRWDAAAWPEPSAGCGPRGAGRALLAVCCWGACPGKIPSAGAAFRQNLACVFFMERHGPFWVVILSPSAFLRAFSLTVGLSLQQPFLFLSKTTVAQINLLIFACFFSCADLDIGFPL